MFSQGLKKANIEHWLNNVNSLSLKLCINDSVTTKTTIIIICLGGQSILDVELSGLFAWSMLQSVVELVGWLAWTMPRQTLYVQQLRFLVGLISKSVVELPTGLSV